MTTDDKAIVQAEASVPQSTGVSLGKGAWDCDTREEIPPEKEVSESDLNLIDGDLQAVVFEEIATMDFPFEGIPTVPPRKDVDHMVHSHHFLR